MVVKNRLDIGNRLKEVRNKLGISQTEFAKQLEMPQTTYSKYELGASVPESVMLYISSIGINLNWLITGNGSMYLDGSGEVFSNAPAVVPADNDPEVFLLPMKNIKLSAGLGIDYPDNEEYIDKVLPIPRKLAARYKYELIGAIARGDSMNPTIKDGEPVAIAKIDHYEGDGIYAITRHNELFVKRLSKIGNRVKIISDNTKYPIETIDPTDDVEEFAVLGKVVFWVHVE